MNKRGFKTTIVAGLAMMLCFVGEGRADKYEVITRKTPVRVSPANNAEIKGYFSQGTMVSGERTGDWVKTEIAKGDGYIFFRNLKKKTEASELLQDQPAMQDNADSRQQGGQSNVVNLRGMKDASTALPQKTQEGKLVVAQLSQQALDATETDLEKGNSVAEFRRLEKERDELMGRLHRALDENQKLKDEMDKLKAAIEIQGFDRYLSAADEGDQVFVRGVGEVLLATVFGKTVVRVPAKASTRADGIFSAAMAERVVHGGFVYYICDTRLLQFNRS